MSRKNDPLYDPIRAIVSDAFDTSREFEWMSGFRNKLARDQDIDNHTEEIVKLVRISTFAVPAN